MAGLRTPVLIVLVSLLGKAIGTAESDMQLKISIPAGTGVTFPKFTGAVSDVGAGKPLYLADCIPLDANTAPKGGVNKDNYCACGTASSADGANGTYKTVTGSADAISAALPLVIAPDVCKAALPYSVSGANKPSALACGSCNATVSTAPATMNVSSTPTPNGAGSLSCAAAFVIASVLLHSH